MDENFYVYRAALVSIGSLYEDYEGPLSDDMVEAAKRIIAERASNIVNPTGDNDLAVSPVTRPIDI